MRKIVLLGMATLLAVSAGSARAATDESKCLAGRAKAWGTYEACVQKLFAANAGDSYLETTQLGKLDTCIAKLSATWTKLQALDESPTCGGLSRFVDNGSTMTDRLTLLTWEKKSGAADNAINYADARDPDNAYALNFDNDDDGAAYNDFLADLNAGTGFSDANSWRLPTLAELLTIRNVPEIGPSFPSWYWSRSVDQTNSGQARRTHFGTGEIQTAPKWGVNLARAVRGGL